MEIGRINQLANNVRSLKEELEQISPGITAERQFTRADLDKAVAGERVKWEKIIDIVIENKYEPDKWPEEVRDRMPMTLREAIRNRGKEVPNV